MFYIDLRNAMHLYESLYTLLIDISTQTQFKII